MVISPSSDQGKIAIHRASRHQKGGQCVGDSTCWYSDCLFGPLAVGGRVLRWPTTFSWFYSHHYVMLRGKDFVDVIKVNSHLLLT